MPRWNLFGQIKQVKNFIQNIGKDQVERAAEIIQEEFDKLIQELQDTSAHSMPFGDLEATVEVVQNSKRQFLARVWIENKVFNILDEGVDDVPRFAADYGLKAFPLHFVRKPGYEPGNQPMTEPDSIDVKPAVIGEDLIYRPAIYEPIPARNFTDLIEERARDRIRAEGLQVDFTVEKVK